MSHFKTGLITADEASAVLLTQKPSTRPDPQDELCRAQGPSAAQTRVPHSGLLQSTTRGFTVPHSDVTRLFIQLYLPFRRAVKREPEKLSFAVSLSSLLSGQVPAWAETKIIFQPKSPAPTFAPPSLGQRLSSVNGHQDCSKTQALRDH